MKNREDTEKNFLEYIKKMQAYKEALHLIFWDLRTGAPKKGSQQRLEVIGVLSEELFQMSVSEEMAAYIATLSAKHQQLAPPIQKLLEETKKEYERSKKIPAREYREYTMLQSQSELIWEEAREKDDFELLRPYLEKIVDFKRKFISYWGYNEHKYNTLLDIYEPGMTVSVADAVFEELKDAILPLVDQIKNKSLPFDTGFLHKPFPKEKQRELSVELLRKLEYDFEAGRLDETVHPFAIGLNPGDVRITTRYDEMDFRTALFGTIHECGHAIYEQNIAEELIGTPLCQGASMGIHESQSLFYENIIARSRAFWKDNYERLQAYSSGQFDGILPEQFYQAINESKPSFIRIEADELTYCLHIIIRYEIEKSLIEGEIEVKDLPELWNKKYESYLGITPDSYTNGVLQDVHWAGGDFGYFPSYAFGYMYAAQFHQAMRKELPNFDLLVEKGDYSPIKQWLTEHIHQFGKMKTPLELIRDATGEELKAQYLIDYLTEKYNNIYQLNNN
ncbi:carboxypeptidase Taq [Bacillus ectoiniformans]|uniref:carboxypeptidase M32 n=1 Tax=Bacillus ectoiniformans TaxID=1494429 RepID=UPI0023BA729B|nr:carboxypeptidase M32 [Bacillus ectoiniformans]MBM7647943.1 carboxypeptidase Taq [Bacillus ectoiniformans]